MNTLLAALLAYSIASLPASRKPVSDSFIRSDVKPADFEKLTSRARAGRTHLAASGSGFFVTKDGYLVTNQHVVDHAAEVVVIDSHATAYLADVITTSQDKDLALLKINLFPKSERGVMKSTKRPTVPYLSLENKCSIGQTVYAVGYPETEILGYEPKVTRGIVSSLSGFRGDKKQFQMDAMITHGNSGCPVVNAQGYVVGVACGGARLSDNYNYAIKMEVLWPFLPTDIGVLRACPGRYIAPEAMTKKVTDALVLILIYTEGACERISATTPDRDSTRKREAETEVRKAILDARLCKLKHEWKELKEVTDWILDKVGETDEVREWNNLARDELGLHLIIHAEADGHDVVAQIKPICGFKNDFVPCDRPVRLYGGRDARGFPVEAELTYEDNDWLWKGTLKCIYDWSGTMEKRIVLKHVGKK